MRLFGTLLLLLISPCTFGQSEVFTLRDTNTLFPLLSHGEMYEDKSAKLTLDDIRKPEILNQFTKAESDIFTGFITSSAFWVRLKLTTEIQNFWYLEYTVSCARTIDFYEIVNGQVIHQKAGITANPSERAGIGRRSLFQLHVSENDTTECFLRITDLAPLTIVIKGGTLLSFTRSEQTGNLLHGIYFGILMLMIVYNLFLYVTSRETVYVFYVLYMVFSALFISYFVGYVVIFPDWVRLMFMHAPVLVPALFGIFGLFFTMKFLNTVERVPVIHKIIIWIIITVNSANVCTLFGWHHLSMYIIQIYGLILSCVCIFTGIKVWRQGYRPAKYYVFGFGAYMSGLTIMIMSGAIGFYNDFALYSLELGSAIEATLLSFAIGDKLNQANRAKNKAQKEALEQLQANEKLIREQNAVLEQKVKERTIEVVTQKEIIEEKHKEITDSINYAERIQRSFLATQELLDKNLNDYFVFFQPKDVVSGDFYWASELNNGNFAFCCADSTGHGVPGAIMSILNISSLEKSIESENTASEILNKTRKIIIERLKKDGSKDGGKDGMDCSMMIFTPDKSKMYCASANNLIWILRQGEITEILPDKMPVGKHDKDELPFTQNEFELQKGDLIYSLTDGMPDQFGGPKGKKFKYARLKDYLLSISNLSMNEQKEKIASEFALWKGDLEQVDDVTIMGIRV